MLITYNETLVKYKSFKDVIKDIDDDQNKKNKFKVAYYDELEYEIVEDERKLREITSFVNEMSENLEHLNEKKAVFDKVSQLVFTDHGLISVLDR